MSFITSILDFVTYTNNESDDDSDHTDGEDEKWIYVHTDKVGDWRIPLNIGNADK